jgi:hypothetical protein
MFVLYVIIHRLTLKDITKVFSKRRPSLLFFCALFVFVFDFRDIIYLSFMKGDIDWKKQVESLN